MMVVFPGQGSQFPGMCKGFYDNFSAARDVFEEVGSVLGLDVASMVFNGSEDELTCTDNAQIALMSCSVAILRSISHVHGIRVGRCGLLKCLAGHSVGEYVAAYEADVMDFRTLVRVLGVRGSAMRGCCSTGGMVALIGTSMDDVMGIISEVKNRCESAVCEMANDNGGGQFVLSFDDLAAPVLEAVLRDSTFSVRRVIKLKVGGPFHSSLMRGAGSRVKEFLSDCRFFNAKVPVISDVTAVPESEGARIKCLLSQQISSPVRWREVVLCAYELGVRMFVEIGPGNVLTNLIKRILSGCQIDAYSICNVEDIDFFVEASTKLDMVA